MVRDMLLNTAVALDKNYILGYFTNSFTSLISSAVRSWVHCDHSTQFESKEFRGFLRGLNIHKNNVTKCHQSTNELE